ncbi:MAG: spermidine synthase [Desulfuromonas sp.]|nr:MAG: spermidine synthase [Desulfuromonas sp.]
MPCRPLIYLLFFISGLSALIYQVLWVRSFSLIFGGSHMAVTTVLSVFMGGLALGGVLGRYSDRHPRPLKLYALLEIGIGSAALLLLGLLEIYPSGYVAFAHLVDNNPTALTLGRVFFAVVALLIPTTLMGLTLPALAGFAARREGSLSNQLSLLYGINTFGAVIGALSAGFFLLRFFTMNLTYGLAITLSLLVGIISLMLDRNDGSAAPLAPQISSNQGVTDPLPAEITAPETNNLILLGIALSGFCALGYEILWTRMLSIVVGTTVYGYTLMLVAFLIGIAGGGASYRLLPRRLIDGPGKGRTIIAFGLTQVLIGTTALLVSYALNDLPNQAFAVEEMMKRFVTSDNGVRQTTNFILGLLYMLVPAFFMGLAFPLAADIVATGRKAGKAVGATLTWNTVGAILGAAISGFLLIHLFGIERSLHYLALINLTTGFSIWASRARLRPIRALPLTAAIAIMLVLAMAPGSFRFWNMKYFAVFNHNARKALASEEKINDLMKSSEVLYYAEGVTSTISVIAIKGGSQSVQVNGRTVASSSRKDQQCQYTLGHLPMLLHKNPRKVWVLGMGTGMTAGATAIHPEVESVVIAELEQHVVPAARTFAAWNHDLLDNPKVSVVFNDGRNFLLTTEERYDVITADPIHPWSQGAAYLYTDEYYRLAAERLREGGIMCQWLPIYELSPRDLQSVTKTFANNFRYTYIWLTDYDAELVGSNTPIELDVATIDRRLAASPAVQADLEKIQMGSGADFLSYCIMGPEGSRAYGASAPLNTDNNLYLEFSAPDSKGLWQLVPANIASLSSYREDITPYLSGTSLAEAFAVTPVQLSQAMQAYDQAHRLHYLGKDHETNYATLMAKLSGSYPWFAPGEFLQQEYRRFQTQIPQLENELILSLTANGIPTRLVLSAVSIRIAPERAKLLIVDNQAKEIYGSIYLDAPEREMEQQLDRHSKQLLETIENSVNKNATSLEAIQGSIKSVIDTFSATEI